MIRVGLTGSIATGKSTTAQMFRNEGVPVHDSDAAVHEVYRGEAVAPIGKLFSQVIDDNGVNRHRLREVLRKQPEMLSKLEAIVHPLVAARREQAASKARQDGEPLMVFDIPLLFETGIERDMDFTVVTFCEPEIQMGRLLKRKGMNAETANMLIARQMPQQEKRDRADFEIDTGLGFDAAQAAVKDIVRELRA
ncbi:MAG: dephospho-CoA kinase [Pseudomonadota bacterium]